MWLEWLPRHQGTRLLLSCSSRSGFHFRSFLGVQDGCWGSRHHVYPPVRTKKEREEEIHVLHSRTVPERYLRHFCLHPFGWSLVTWVSPCCKTRLGYVDSIQGSHVSGQISRALGLWKKGRRTGLPSAGSGFSVLCHLDPRQPRKHTPLSPPDDMLSPHPRRSLYNPTQSSHCVPGTAGDA